MKHAIRVGVNYGGDEEVHWSVKNCNPRSKARLFEATVGLAYKMGKQSNQPNASTCLRSRGQVSCLRIGGCPRNLTSGELP